MVMNEEEDNFNTNMDDEDMTADRDFYIFIDHDLGIMVTKS